MHEDVPQEKEDRVCRIPDSAHPCHRASFHGELSFGFVAIILRAFIVQVSTRLCCCHGRAAAALLLSSRVVFLCPGLSSPSGHRPMNSVRHEQSFVFVLARSRCCRLLRVSLVVLVAFLPPHLPQPYPDAIYGTHAAAPAPLLVK